MRRPFSHSHPAKIFAVTFTTLLLITATIAAQGRLASNSWPGKNRIVTASPTVAPQSSGSAVDRFVTIYGSKIHYIEAGSGPVVILLHGLGGDTSNWAPTLAPLSAKYHVIVPDQIGFGLSDKPLINYRVATLVDFLEGFYQELKIERATLVGNSLGGWVAAAYALAHPQKVERLVLVDAAGFSLPGGTNPGSLNVLNPATREGVRQIMSLIFYNKQLFMSDAVIDQIFASKMTAGDGYTIQRFIEAIARGDDVLDGRLAAIRQPTLIVWGREDELTTLAQFGQRFKKEITVSRLLIIEKCGHVPPIEKAAEFNSALMRFLGGEEVGAK